jgi:hypothetical protein
MKHPDAENWMSFLYSDDLSAKEQAELQSHLDVCDECRNHVREWRETRAQLDQWSLARPPHQGWIRSTTWMRPAVAACLVLAAGFAFGRYASPPGLDWPAERDRLRNDLRREFSEEVAAATQSAIIRFRSGQASFLGQYTKLQEQSREEDLAVVLAYFREIEKHRQNDHAQLRRDLETVALVTDASLRAAHGRMSQLADFSSRNSSPQQAEPPIH